MTMHPFLLTPGIWLGEGKIKLNMMEEFLPFYTRWKVHIPDDSDVIEAYQEIEISGMGDKMTNEFYVSERAPEKFAISLENQNLGKVVGSGLIKPNVISWEFRAPDIGFDGYEVYEMKDKNNYAFYAEYSTKDEFRTEVKGKIWKKEV